MAEQSLKAYHPTWRDQLSTLIFGNERASPGMRKLQQGLLGSTGLGHTGNLDLIDMTPLAAPLWLQEGNKAYNEGDAVAAALNYASMVPMAGSGIKVGKGFAEQAADFLGDALAPAAKGLAPKPVGFEDAFPKVEIGEGNLASDVKPSFFTPEQEAKAKASILEDFPDTTSPKEFIGADSWTEAKMFAEAQGHEFTFKPELNAQEQAWSDAEGEALRAMDKEALSKKVGNSAPGWGLASDEEEAIQALGKEAFPGKATTEFPWLNEQIDIGAPEGEQVATLDDEIAAVLGQASSPLPVTGIKEIDATLDPSIPSTYDDAMNAVYQQYKDKMITFDEATKMTKAIKQEIELLTPAKPEVAKLSPPSAPAPNAPKVGSVPWLSRDMERVPIPKTGIADPDIIQALGMNPKQVLYHSSKNKYTEMRDPKDYDEKAIFLADDPGISSNYGGNIYPVHARMENPLVKENFGAYHSSKVKKAIADAKALGHDSVILEGMSDVGGNNQTQYLVFGPNQVRSVWAKFDPAKKHLPDLMAGLGGLGVLGGATLGSDDAAAAEAFPFRPFLPTEKVDNADGSFSTERSRGVKIGGEIANVPSLWKSEDGKTVDLEKMTDDQLGSFAEKYEKMLQKKFPRFATWPDAEAAAKARSAAGGAGAP